MRWEAENVAVREPTAASPPAVPGGGRTPRGRPNMHRATTAPSGRGVLGLSRGFFAPQIWIGSEALDLKDTLFQGSRRLRNQRFLLGRIIACWEVSF